MQDVSIVVRVGTSFNCNIVIIIIIIIIKIAYFMEFIMNMRFSSFLKTSVKF